MGGRGVVEDWGVVEDGGSWRMGGRDRRRGTDKTQILIDDIYFHNFFSRSETANLFAVLLILFQNSNTFTTEKATA